jgi:hypothetical protein
MRGARRAIERGYPAVRVGVLGKEEKEVYFRVGDDESAVMSLGYEFLVHWPCRRSGIC